MKAFVTGASGFVGTHLCRALVARGAQVRGLVYEPERVAAVASLGVDAVEGSLDVERLVPAMTGMQVVFHVAGLVSMAARDAELCRAVNVEGTRAVFAAARRAGVRRVVHTSTAVCIGGRRDGAALDEDSPFELSHLPLPYVVTKRAAERIALDNARDDLEVVVCCPGSVIGPVDAFGSAGNALIVDYLRGRLRWVPAHVTTWSDVRDVAAGHIAAAQRGRSGERYILGGEATSLIEMARRIDRVAGDRHPPRGVLPGWLLGPLAWTLERTASRPPLTPALLDLLAYDVRLDSTKARRTLGYAPRALDTAIADTLDWFADAIADDDRPWPLGEIGRALHAEAGLEAPARATHRATVSAPPARVFAAALAALDPTPASGTSRPGAHHTLRVLRRWPDRGLLIALGGEGAAARRWWTITCRPRFPGGTGLRWHVHGEGARLAGERRRIRRLVDHIRRVA